MNNRHRISKRKNKENYIGIFIKNIFIKVFLVVFLLVFCSLFMKKNNNYKSFIFDKIYNHNVSFAFIKKYYNKYLGDIIPFESISPQKKVISLNKIEYIEKSTYNNGVKLKLDNNYLIPILNDGIVIFIGEKEGFNNTIIIEDDNRVDYIYGNLDDINVKLYDYVKKGDLLGTVKDNSLYLMFEKDGNVIDYKKYIK